MTRRTSASTRRADEGAREALADRRDLFLMMATGLMIAAGIGWGAAATQHLLPIALVVAVGIVAIGGLLTDVFIGLAIGLVAAAVVAGSQLLFNRTAASAPAYVATLLLLILLGGVTGMASDRLRRERRRQRRAEAMAIVPAGGSLGLLGLDDAQLRLVEELARAHRYGRPLSVITLRVHVDEALSLSSEDMQRARRAVARVLESELHSLETPYVIDEETFGVVVPETNAENARLLAGSLVADAGNATFADRTAGKRRAVREVAELSVGIHEAMGTEVEAREQQAEALLIASRETLQPVPPEDAAVGPAERA